MLMIDRVVKVVIAVLKQIRMAILMILVASVVIVRMLIIIAIGAPKIVILVKLDISVIKVIIVIMVGIALVKLIITVVPSTAPLPHVGTRQRQNGLEIAAVPPHLHTPSRGSLKTLALQPKGSTSPLYRAGLGEVGEQG